MVEVEIAGADEDTLPAPSQMRRMCRIAAATAGVESGHMAVEFVDEQRITALNSEYRGKDEPTDVLSFPIDGAGSLPASAAPRELGDVVICPAHTADLLEAVVHGTLHLVGMDHETDDGEMLVVQRELLAWERRSTS
jgi:probable rRNA maturation factor